MATPHIKRLCVWGGQPYGDAVDIVEDASVADGGDMGVPSFRGCDEGDGTQGDWYVYLQVEEHGGTVNSYLPHEVPISGYREGDGILDTNEVVLA